MAHTYLHRTEAPFGTSVWDTIDRSVVSIAKSALSARKIIHTEGPYGFGLQFLPGAEKEIKSSRDDQALLSTSTSIPLTTITCTFSLSSQNIQALEHTGIPFNLEPVAKAVLACVQAEDTLIFSGTKQGAPGLLNTPGVRTVKMKPWKNVGTGIEEIINGITSLDAAGFHGPYSLGLSPALYNMLLRRYPQAESTELAHVQSVVTGGVVKVPALTTGGILLASQKEIASIVLGQDLLTGFEGPSGTQYRFVLSESLALRLASPEAICRLDQTDEK